MKIPGKIYSVGGSVRDLIMGRTPHDKDFVVVGATPEDMIAAGFNKVGADFPVFLHPETREEYALARTERKNGTGYKGFVTDFSKDVTLEDDLIRRDLTINAMAMDDAGNLIDPFNGQTDIKNKVLRATSDAFKDDPLRVLRIARFAAKLGFTIDDATNFVCMQIAETDEFANLTRERVGIELMKTLETDSPELFFWALRDMGALKVHFPEIHALIGQTQPQVHHPEGDAFVHTMLVLKEAVADSSDVVRRFCALTHDLGKGVTPKDVLPSHPGHEAAGVPLVKEMADRLKLDNNLRTVGSLVARFHTHVHRIYEMKPTTIVRLMNDLGVGNQTSLENYKILADVSMYDAHGRGEFLKNKPYPNRDHFVAMAEQVATVKLSAIHTIDEIKAIKPLKRAEVVDRAKAKKIVEFRNG